MYKKEDEISKPLIRIILLMKILIIVMERGVQALILMENYTLEV